MESHKNRNAMVLHKYLRLLRLNLKLAASVDTHTHVHAGSLGLEDALETKYQFSGIAGFTFTNSYLALYQFFTKRITMKHCQFKRNLATAVAPFTVYNVFNARNN